MSSVPSIERVPFETSRANGRSNIQVIIDLVATEPQGTLFTYPALKEALERGTAQKFTRTMIGKSVRGALKRLQKEHKRHLEVVVNEGYRLAQASEHLALAGKRERRGETQIRHAIEVLSGTDLDVLSAPMRAITVAQTMLVSGVYHQVRALAARQKAHADAINALFARSAEQEDRLAALEANPDRGGWAGQGASWQG